MRQQIEKEAGGNITASFPSVPVAGSVSVTIKRSSGADLEGVGVVAQAVADPLAVTLPVGSVGNKAATFCSVSGLAGASYPLPDSSVELRSSSTEQAQFVSVRAVDKAAEKIHFTRPLEFALAGGDKLYSREVSYTLVASQCPVSEQNFRAVFKATSIDGVAISVEKIYDVGLRASYLPATEADVYAEWPELHRVQVVEWENAETIPLLKGYERVASSLWAMGRNPNRIRDAEILRPLIVNRTFHIMASSGLVPSAWRDNVEGRLGFLSDEYDQLLKTMVASILWYDDDDDGVESVSETDTNVFMVTFVQ